VTERLRICLLADSLGPDAGTEKLVAELACRLDPSRIEAHVCCFAASERLSLLGKYVRTAVFPLERINSTAGIHQLWRFRSYLKRHGIQAIHSFMNKSAIFSVLASRRTPARTIITSRFNTGYWHSNRRLAIFRIINRYSTHIVANSEKAKAQTVAVENVAPEKVTVFYPGVDLTRFTPGCELRDGSLPVVGIVANFRKVKDLPLFLRAAAVVSKACPARFLLVGQGDLRPALQQLSEQLNISRHVEFSPLGASVPEALGKMSVACLSSESEGLPNAVLEYMAAGLPVVATDVGGVPELVEDNVTGFLVRKRTPEAFAEPIIRLLQDPGLRLAMGKSGRERAEKELDIAAAVRRLETFYFDAVTKTRPPSTSPKDRK
jgi:glycosyltransferase involved in cell wall biosynthesis